MSPKPTGLGLGAPITELSLYIDLAQAAEDGDRSQACGTNLTIPPGTPAHQAEVTAKLLFVGSGLGNNLITAFEKPIGAQQILAQSGIAPVTQAKKATIFQSIDLLKGKPYPPLNGGWGFLVQPSPP
ncbi:hypothetical protein BKA66DRAFT_438720 [Pyrenochaeta sp. MPI-SDFR-AT-0127]|nr:hypothetical protein BKA66DRAFT_438720 [Pyrenochaeta sp. MPI-SDFR-AT-0127]